MKYLFTEVVCAIVGGPELVTSLAFAETRLLLPARQMFFLLEAAKDASDHFHSSKLRAELLQALHQASADYIVDQRTTSPPSQRHSERAVKIEALSALAGVPLIYIPKGGVVRITFDASPAQLEQVAAGLADMGLKTVDRTKVKTASDAANGNLLSPAVIAARHAAPGAFVAARRRCFGDPRTLYGRTGGVFGLAMLADALMEAWMAEPTLNANTLVTRWHTSQQRAGFKFLVTQILGYLSGGPQRYTGRPMDVAHKHLGITAGDELASGNKGAWPARSVSRAMRATPSKSRTWADMPPTFLRARTEALQTARPLCAVGPTFSDFTILDTEGMCC